MTSDHFLEISNIFGSYYNGGNVSFFPCGKKLAFSSGKKIMMLNLEKKLIKNLKIQTRSTILSIDISRSGKFLAIADNSNLVIIFNINKNKIESKVLIKGRSFCLKWSPFDNYIALIVQKNIQIWKKDEASYKSFSGLSLCKTFHDHYSDIVSIDWNGNGKLLLTHGYDKVLRIFFFRKNNFSLEIKSNSFKKGLILSNFSVKSNELYALCKNSIFSIWKIKGLRKNEKYKTCYKKTFKKIGNYAIDNEKFFNIHAWVNSVKNFLIICDSSGNLRLFNIRYTKSSDFSDSKKLQILKTIKPEVCLNFKKAITYISGFKDSSVLILGNCFKSNIIIYNLKKKKMITMISDDFRKLSSFAFSHNENLIIFGTFSGKLFAYSSFSGLLLIKFMNSTKPILGLKFLPKNSRIFFTSCADNIIRLYDLKKCSVIRTFLSKKNEIISGIISVDPKSLFLTSSNSNNFLINVWEIRKGRLLESLSGHKGIITGLSFVKFSSKIVSCSTDKTVRIWDLTKFVKNKTDIYCTIFNFRQNINTFTIHPIYPEIVILSNTGEVFFYDYEKLRITSTIRNAVPGYLFKKDKYRPEAVSMDFCTLGNFLLIYVFEKKVIIIESSTLIKIKDLSYNQKSVENLPGETTFNETYSNFRCSSLYNIICSTLKNAFLIYFSGTLNFIKLNHFSYYHVKTKMALKGNFSFLFTTKLIKSIDFVFKKNLLYIEEFKKIQKLL